MYKIKNTMKVLIEEKKSCIGSLYMQLCVHDKFWPTIKSEIKPSQSTMRIASFYEYWGIEIEGGIGILDICSQTTFLYTIALGGNVKTTCSLPIVELGCDF